MFRGKIIGGKIYTIHKTQSSKGEHRPQPAFFTARCTAMQKILLQQAFALKWMKLQIFHTVGFSGFGSFQPCCAAPRLRPKL